MKKMLKKGFNSQDLAILGIYLMALFPLFPNRIKWLPAGLLLVFAVIFFVREKNRVFKWQLFLINSGIYLCYVISLLYSSNLPNALRKLETGFSLLLFPLVFGLIWQLGKKVDKDLMLRRVIVLFAGSVLMYTVVIFSFLISKRVYLYFEDPNFFRHFTEYIPLIGQHSIYASIFLSLGLLFLIYLIFEDSTRVTRNILIVLAIFLVLLLLVSLASKGVILAFLSATCFFILAYVEDLRKRILAVGIIIGLVVLGAVYSPSLSKRITELNLSYKPSVTIEEGNSTQIRKAIYLCSLRTIEGNWLLGTGIGDINDSLVECYEDTSEVLVAGRYNTHNQYLSILLGNGIFGLAALCMFLFLSYRSAISKRNHLFISILLFYSMAMLFENILERQGGVILFAFLINFLCFISGSEKKAASG